MTNSISDFISNNVQSNKEQTKSNQYQTKDNGKSFYDIFNNLNQASSKIEEKKTVDNRYVKDNSNDDMSQKNKTVDNHISKNDNEVKSKTAEKTPVKEDNNHDLKKDVSNKRTETSNQIEANKKADNSEVKSKTDTENKVVNEHKTVDNNSEKSQVNDKVSEEEQDSDTDNSQSDNDNPTDSNKNKEEEAVPEANNTAVIEETISSQLQGEILDTETISTKSSQTDIVDEEVLEQALKVPLEDTITSIAITSQVSSPATKPMESTENDTDLQNASVQSQGKNSSVNLATDSLPNINNKPEESNTAENIESVKNSILTELLDTSNTGIEEVDSSLQIKVANNIAIDKNTEKEPRDLKETSPLLQTMLNELDAEVTSSSQNTGSNLFNQQNASEQVVKLSIEPLTKTEGSDFSNVINQDGLKTNLDKPQLNTLQSPVKELNKTDIMNQITDKVSVVKAGSNEKIEIILKPENLGKVNVEIQSIKGVISATLIAENKQVKELLEKNIETLRNNLSSQGLNLNNLSVKVEEPNKSAFNNFNFGQGQFDAETNSQHQNPQKAYKSDYNDSMGLDSSVLGTDEGIVSTTEFKDDNSLHAGMVDYKV